VTYLVKLGEELIGVHSVEEVPQVSFVEHRILGVVFFSVA